MTRSRITRACLLTIALLCSALTMGAAVSYSIDCSVSSGFIADPNDHRRVGYITAFQGLGLLGAVSPDLTVTLPYLGALPGFVRRPTANTAAVVGIIENFKWAGGTGDPIEINFYVSQNNALQLKSLMQSTLKSTKVDQLGWWIADFDQDAKQWYQAASLMSPGTVSGTLANKSNPELYVNLVPVMVNGVALYRISLKVSPPANTQLKLAFASSLTTPVLKTWGLQVGALPPNSM